ncbi:MAG: PilN domain-containing protein [Blastocatellia bacterium]|nr:PilN domain-containing protein [Blastocatellia bacterium]
MIKVNLLHSVTERQGGTISAVDRQVSNPSTRLALMSVAVAFLLLAVIGWDVVSTQMAKTAAENEKAKQEQIARDLEVVMKEQKELEDKIKNIDLRIEAIKKLRNSQAGPSAVLEAIRERIAMTPGLYLSSIEQAGDKITITGNSPEEGGITQFGRSLEFSNGLFSNLSIETQRKEVANQLVSATAGGEAPKVNIIDFTITTSYTPEKGAGANNPAPTAAAATGNPGQPAPPVQVAKN